MLEIHKLIGLVARRDWKSSAAIPLFNSEESFKSTLLGSKVFVLESGLDLNKDELYAYYEGCGGEFSLPFKTLSLERISAAPFQSQTGVEFLKYLNKMKFDGKIAAELPSLPDYVMRTNIDTTCIFVRWEGTDVLLANYLDNQKYQSGDNYFRNIMWGSEDLKEYGIEKSMKPLEESKAWTISYLLNNCSQAQETMNQVNKVRSGSGEKTIYRIRSVIHVTRNKLTGKHKSPLSGNPINYTHRFRVRGHWRKVKRLGKGPDGAYSVYGKTWVIDSVKGAKHLPLIEKTRII